MLSAITIDFTREDIGLWPLFVVIPLAYTSKNFKAQKGKILRPLFRDWLIGSGIALFVCGLLLAWQSFGLQYFIRMQISDENVVLKFHWPNPDRVIPITSLTDVSFKRKGKRLQVETATETFRSYGFGKLLDEEYEQIRKLREKISSDRHD